MVTLLTPVNGFNPILPMAFLNFFSPLLAFFFGSDWSAPCSSSELCSFSFFSGSSILAYSVVIFNSNIKIFKFNHHWMPNNIRNLIGYLSAKYFFLMMKIFIFESGIQFDLKLNFCFFEWYVQSANIKFGFLIKLNVRSIYYFHEQTISYYLWTLSHCSFPMWHH